MKDRCVSALALGITLVGVMAATVSANGQELRRSVGGAVALEWNGSQVGFLRGAEGGDVAAEVMTTVSQGSFAKKSVSGIKINDLTLQIGPDMDKPIYEAIAASWQGTTSLASGAVLMVAYDSKVMSRREFSSAKIVATTFPALDATSKEPAAMTVVLRPEGARVVKGAGTVQPTMGGNSKAWLPGNFRLEIPGLDCTHVRKIDALTVKMTPGKSVEFPNLEVTLNESNAETWAAWLKSFVIDGNNGESAEKTGSIVFFGSDAQTELGRISLYNLGISGLKYDALGAGAGPIRTVTAQLYCERMALQWTGGAGAGALQTRTLLR
jgi:hypothetical protein